MASGAAAHAGEAVPVQVTSPGKVGHVKTRVDSLSGPHQEAAAMKRSRFSEEQVAFAPAAGRERHGGRRPLSAFGVSEATFSVWKRNSAHERPGTEEHGQGPASPPTAVPRPHLGAAPVWLPAHSCSAPAGGVAGRQESGLSVVPPGRTADPAAQACGRGPGQGPEASGTGGCAGAWTLCNSSTDRVSGVDRRRSVESRESDPRGPAFVWRTGRRGGPGGGGIARGVPAIDHRRSWHGIRLEGAGSVGSLPRRGARFHAAWQTDG